MSGLPASVAGFTTIPVAYSPSSPHIIYARPHVGSKKIQKQPFPIGRTLFLVNIPPDATERELTFLFKYAATIEKVTFDSVEHESEDKESEGEDDIEVKDDTQEQPRKKRKVTK